MMNCLGKYIMRERNYGFVLSFLPVFMFMCGHAQSFTAPKDEALIRKKLAGISQNTTSIKSDFVQEKNLSMVSEKIISKGTFYFEKENKIRLEYHTPFYYLMVLNNGKILIKDDAKSTQMDMHKNKVFQQVNNIIVSCVSGTALSNSDFTVKLLENAAQVKLEMVPAGKSLKEFFSNINVYFDKKDYTVTRIEMNEPSGDNTIINFSNKQINGKIAEELFAVK
jgi:outer membrane lipoprotein-sorting protein